MKLATLSTAAICLVATSSASAQTILIDFGRHNGVDGNATVSPDVNGNTWNNLSQNGDFEIAAGFTASDLVDTAGNGTSVDVTTLDIFRSNGTLNGGLLAPDPTLLGDFAIPTATQDYWFVESNIDNGVMVFSDLDPTLTYQLRLFGTRATDTVRQTNYIVTDANGASTQLLQTSGAGIGNNGVYNGNDDTIITFGSITPDANNSFSLELDIASGGFAYVGIAELSVVPEPASLGLLGVAGLALVRRRR